MNKPERDDSVRFVVLFLLKYVLQIERLFGKIYISQLRLYGQENIDKGDG